MIKNGKDRSMEFGVLPDLGNALFGWFRPLTFRKLAKSTINFKLVETGEFAHAMGVIQVQGPTQLMMKPEGQREWNWYTIHALPGLVLALDEVVGYEGKNYRVKIATDYAAYGYIVYEVIEDYT